MIVVMVMSIGTIKTQATMIADDLLIISFVYQNSG